MATFYEEVLSALDAGGVRFILVGGVAVILHGVPRTTADLDIVVDLEATNVDALVAVLSALGFSPRAPVPATQLRDADARRMWIEAKGMKAFTFVRGTGWLDEVDVLIDSPLDYSQLAGEAVRIPAGARTLSIASIDALITMKSGTGRAQDESDVDALRRLKEALDAR